MAYIYLFRIASFRNKGNIFKQKQVANISKERNDPEIPSTLLTYNALAVMDPKKRKELLSIIGRDQELRLKDRIVYFGGGRYLLHGYGRFGASALIDQIIKLAQYDMAELNINQDKGIIMTVRIDATTLSESDGAISALIREFSYEAKHGDYARSFKTQIERLNKKRLAIATKSTDEKAISIKAAPIPGIEAQFSRKFGTAGSSQNITGESLLKLIVDYLDHAEQINPTSFEMLVDKVLGNTTIPSRIIFVIDRIKSDTVFSLLKRMNLLNDNRISVFAVVKEEFYADWEKNAETFNSIQELNFQLHYIPCLWEERSNFVDHWINGAFPNEPVGEDKNLKRDFKDHIAFISRGSPGDAVIASLSSIYCEYKFGEPRLNLKKLRSKGEIKLNAKLQRILTKNWRKILSSRFENVNEEVEDRARRAIYNLIDQINFAPIFTLKEIQNFALSSKLRISNSDPIVLNILDSLLTVLVKKKYLEQDGEFYRVSHLSEPEDLLRQSTIIATKHKTKVSRRMN